MFYLKFANYRDEIIHDCFITKEQWAFNPIALRTAKTQWSFGRFECNTVKAQKIKIVESV